MSNTLTMVQVAAKAVDKVGDFVAGTVQSSGNMFEAAQHIVTDAITKYGQQATDAILRIVRINAIQTLITGLITGIAVIFVLALDLHWFQETQLVKRIG